MAINILRQKLRNNQNRSENVKRSTEIKRIIAQESNLALSSVNNKTAFMAAQNISYFDCMDILYVLQHRFNVSLPESNYIKYRTVGDLIRDINRQSRRRLR